MNHADVQQALDTIQKGRFAVAYRCASTYPGCPVASSGTDAPVAACGACQVFDRAPRGGRLAAADVQTCHHLCVGGSHRAHEVMNQRAEKVQRLLGRRKRYSDFYKACVDRLRQMPPFKYQYASIFATFLDTTGSERLILRGSSFPTCRQSVNRVSYRPDDRFIVPWVWHNNRAVRLVAHSEYEKQLLTAQFGFDPFFGKYSECSPDEILVVPIHRTTTKGSRLVSGVLCFANLVPRPAADQCRSGCEVRLLQALVDQHVGPRMYDLGFQEFSRSVDKNIRNLTTDRFQTLLAEHRSASTALAECIAPFFRQSGFEEITGRSKKVAYVSYLDRQGDRVIGYRPVAVSGELGQKFCDRLGEDYSGGYCPINRSLTAYTLSCFQEFQEGETGRTFRVVSLNDLPRAEKEGRYRNILGNDVCCALSCPIVAHGENRRDDTVVAVLTIMSDSYDLMPTQYYRIMELMADAIGNVMNNAERILLPSRMTIFLHDMTRLEQVHNWVRDPDGFRKVNGRQGWSSDDAQLFAQDNLILCPSIVTAHNRMLQSTPIDLSKEFNCLFADDLILRLIHQIMRYVLWNVEDGLSYARRPERYFDFQPADLAGVRVDPDFFAVCLLNLLKNALKAESDAPDDRRGKIRVEVRGQDDHCEVAVTNYCDDEHWRKIQKKHEDPRLRLLEDRLDESPSGLGLFVTRRLTSMYRYGDKTSSLKATRPAGAESVRFAVRFPYTLS